ncbi:hypothetical protein BaRGS_00004227 [Batillaria attramentaria]|uniref:Leucine-rich repeat and IQ domain-containing protein 3 n=1 Tax=Batillaria attramentaria TaxID=370345 RepID=A0ABD0LYW8_9CAEN
MVSIPDWAKFTRAIDTIQKPDATALLSKYYKQREQEAIKQAEERGYFLVPSMEYLLKNMGPYSGTSKEITRVFLVRLVGVHLRKLGDISLCTSLQICNLSNNFLTKIDALCTCQQLVKLDLHGNQLTSIPGPPFWSSLRKLRALNLHDNPLGKFETLQSLAACPKLAIMTLFDTPLFLKKNYRHHVVNSIWTLKALDHHVISDEEIIEDALFGGHFAALSPSLKIDLCPPSPMDANYMEEVQLYRQLEARINHILKKHSPVIIVQRYLRGYFARKKLGLTRKFPPRQQSQQVLRMPPSSTSDHSVANLELPPQTSGLSQSGMVPPPSPLPGANLVSSGFLPMISDAHSEPGGTQRSIQINLAKLQTGTLQTLQDEAETLEPTFRPTARSALDQTARERRKKKEEKPKTQRIKSVKQFFGPVVDTKPDYSEDGDEEDEMIPVTNYRLQGSQPNLLLADATTDMILSRIESGRFVREAEAERVQRVKALPPPTRPHYDFKTDDQRLFSKVHGTMGLSCLVAVQKAYKDREKAEKATARMEYILAMRDERQRAKERIHMYHDEKRNQAIRRRDQDRARILDQMEKQELKRLNYLDRQHESKSRAVDLAKSFQADNTFMTEFNSQHTSVSKALLRHDRQARLEDKLSSRKGQVQTLRNTEVDQQETVKKYMEHRQLMRQTETAMSRAALDTRMLQETTERMMEARQRVAHIKQKEATVQAFYPLPPSNVPPAISTAPAGMSRWEAGVISQQGRVGRHNTVLI